jgi:hypothetical protein
MFVALRDRRRNWGEGKKGPMGAFETAGDIILSYEPTSDCQTDDNEKWTFDNASLDTVKRSSERYPQPPNLSVSTSFTSIEVQL